ncbi:MAG: DUF2961 domain-containing protein [Armatimonadetes bacterium]|nr:DUF2961 domain-containing protein [Armatimonadota bacterium]
MVPLGIECLAHPLVLAAPNHAVSRLASSYDRRGGNHDWSNYLRAEGRAAVMLDTQGPGCVTRLWTADPRAGTVRLFLENRSEPAIECPFAELFTRLPLSFGIGGESPDTYERSRTEARPMGHTSYAPIPFRQGCKITIEPEDDYLYYQINYRLYPPGAPVDVWNPAQPENSPGVREAQAVWAAWERGEPLFSWDGATIQTLSLASGQAAVFLEETGPGTIHGLRFQCPPASDARAAAHRRDGVWLIAHFDDDEPRDPSIRAPLGPLCLDFGQQVPPRALWAGTDPEGGYYLFFPMPYARFARLQLVNRSLFPLPDIRVSLLQERLAAPADLFRFRAAWHLETPFGPDHRDYGGVACRLLNLDGRDNYELLNMRGGGTFVGCGFHIDLSEAPTDRAAGEGDEMFFLDDDPRLTHYGTGTEDYVNDAWGIRGYTGPLSGDALTGAWGDDPQIFGYRLHGPDAIPFVRRGRFTLEHGTGNNCSGLYRSVAYWYRDPAASRTSAEEARWEALLNKTTG